MDDWLKQLQEALDRAAQDASERWAEVSKQATQVVEQVVEPAIEQAIDQWVDDSLEVLDQVEQALSPTFNQMNVQLDDALDAGLLFFDQQIAPWIEETTAPVTHIVNPWLQDHPACIGCQHYHGTVYGGEMLVCGMHPYGPEDKTCPDWASAWPTNSEDFDQK